MFAVIMAGGKGSRFWPRSREKMPKHLLDIQGERTIIRETVDRIRPLVPPERTLIVTGRSHAAELIRQHPRTGYEMLLKSPEITEWSRLVVLQHHEKFNGGGYPSNLRGTEISMMARVVAVADVYDALTTARPFRPAMSPYLSTKLLLSNTDNQFDPAILAVFLRRMSIYPPGSVVRLNDGSLAAVARSNPGAMLRPVVRMMKDPHGRDITGTPELDLLFEKNLYITGPAEA